MNEVILKMKNIHKQFSGVYALNGVNFELKYGEVHALLGENGAGKSTLIKILAGIHPVDKGEIIIKGKTCIINGVHTSHANGISVIHQELCLVPYMTVAENIFLGREPTWIKGCFVKYSTLNKMAQDLLDSLGLEIKSTQKISDLSVAQQQMIEIVKALSVEAEIIVMDEPTASLTDKEVTMLFKTIKNLKKKNIAIIYISHRMEELFEITDRITVLRDSKFIGTRVTSCITKDELITMMVGRELKDLYKRTPCFAGNIILEVKNLERKNVLNNISFDLRKGEILGFSGLVGSGRTELMRSIFGIDNFDSGEIILDGKKLSIECPADAMKNGLALVPENRKEQGLVLIQSVGYNITLTILKEFLKFPKVNIKKEKLIIDNYIEKLLIKTPTSNQLVRNLSGGNQQKIVIAKWLATNPKVLILDEPTRGVDVGAKAEIYAIMDMLAKQGVGIIMVSSDLPEVLNISDRVLVMHKGEIMAILKKNELNQEKIMYYATGRSKYAN